MNIPYSKTRGRSHINSKKCPSHPISNQNSILILNLKTISIIKWIKTIKRRHLDKGKVFISSKSLNGTTFYLNLAKIIISTLGKKVNLLCLIISRLIWCLMMPSLNTIKIQLYKFKVKANKARSLKKSSLKLLIFKIFWTKKINIRMKLNNWRR